MERKPLDTVALVLELDQHIRAVVEFERRKGRKIRRSLSLSRTSAGFGWRAECGLLSASDDDISDKLTTNLTQSLCSD